MAERTLAEAADQPVSAAGRRKEQRARRVRRSPTRPPPGRVGPHEPITNVSASSKGTARGRQSRDPQGASTAVLTTFDDDSLRQRADQAGAAAYLVKAGSPELIIDAIFRALGS